VLNPHEIPDFKKINDWFESCTNWQIEVVKGLIPVENFFSLLADKKFSASTWLRNKNSLDYIEEPDMFHDVFGHIPLLSNPLFSSFAHEFGKLGRSFIGNTNAILALQRLYWFTIEFGLIKEDSIKAYGAGIISSVGETENALALNTVHLNFDVEKVLSKEFRTDSIQTEYVVIDSFEQLFNAVLQINKTLTKRNLSF
jgi:phenylalanine-4-hydroxylase